MCNFQLTCKLFLVSTTSFTRVLVHRGGWTEPRHRRLTNRHMLLTVLEAGRPRSGAGVDMSRGDTRPGGRFLAVSLLGGGGCGALWPHSRGLHPDDLVTSGRCRLLMPSHWGQNPTREFGGTHACSPQHPGLASHQNDRFRPPAPCAACDQPAARVGEGRGKRAACRAGSSGEAQGDAGVRRVRGGRLPGTRPRGRQRRPRPWGSSARTWEPELSRCS